MSSDGGCRCPTQEKLAKLSYLTKIIDVVGIASGEPVLAKPLKVRTVPIDVSPWLGLRGSLSNSAVAMPTPTMRLGRRCVCVRVQVVAGHEPELTNAFLQQLGRLATTTDAADAVQRVLAGEHQSDAGGAPPATCVRPPVPSRLDGYRRRRWSETGMRNSCVAPPLSECAYTTTG